MSCSGKLDCKELQSALSVGGLQFSLPTVNILLAKHDRNRKKSTNEIVLDISGEKTK